MKVERGLSVLADEFGEPKFVELSDASFVSTRFRLVGVQKMFGAEKGHTVFLRSPKTQQSMVSVAEAELLLQAGAAWTKG